MKKKKTDGRTNMEPAYNIIICTAIGSTRAAAAPVSHCGCGGAQCLLAIDAGNSSSEAGVGRLCK